VRALRLDDLKPHARSSLAHEAPDDLEWMQRMGGRQGRLLKFAGKKGQRGWKSMAVVLWGQEGSAQEVGGGGGGGGGDTGAASVASF
jgi:hypothetical protein